MTPSFLTWGNEVYGMMSSSEMEKKRRNGFCRKEKFNLELVIFDFPVEYLHGNMQKAWEHIASQRD